MELLIGGQHMSMMTLEVEVGRGLVELTGSNCKYWQGCGLPDYEGPIAGLPPAVINTLVELGAIKNIHLNKELP
jgi:hypothetical protein